MSVIGILLSGKRVSGPGAAAFFLGGVLLFTGFYILVFSVCDADKNERKRKKKAAGIICAAASALVLLMPVV